MVPHEMINFSIYSLDRARLHFNVMPQRDIFTEERS